MEPVGPVQDPIFICRGDPARGDGDEVDVQDTLVVVFVVRGFVGVLGYGDGDGGEGDGFAQEPGQALQGEDGVGGVGEGGVLEGERVRRCGLGGRGGGGEKRDGGVEIRREERQGGEEESGWVRGGGGVIL